MERDRFVEFIAFKHCHQNHEQSKLMETLQKPALHKTFLRFVFEPFDSPIKYPTL